MARRNKSGPGRDEELRPTSGAEWRQARETGYAKRLWSGFVAQLRTPDLGDLVEQGQIPDALTPLVTRMLYLGMDKTDEEQLQKLRSGRDLTEQERAQWRETLRVVCVASFVKPRIVANPTEDDEISIEDVSFPDQTLVWDFAVGGAAMLKTFRTESFADVAAVFDGQTDDDAAELPAADADTG